MKGLSVPSLSKSGEHRARSPVHNVRPSLKFVAFIILISTAFIQLNTLNWLRFQYGARLDTIEFPELSRHCAHIPPIPATSFGRRQTSLARTLFSLNASVYIVEPSASALFYANISSDHWRLSERPMLLAIAPIPGNDIQANITILTPRFESARARLLPFPTPSVYSYNFVTWAEHENPYTTLINALGLSADNSVSSNSSIFVDQSTRMFIVDGIQAAAPNIDVKMAPTGISLLREQKSTEEIEILKCANEATLLAVRATHKRMRIGMHESEARALISRALATVGLTGGGCITLFGENAALPHGSGTDRALQKQDFALFDCGGSLHGYWSDVTRTVALPDSKIPDEHMRIWNLVHTAQTIALFTAQGNRLTSQPDDASRGFLTAMGYGQYFTHRLGHGIGLEVHESPYLRGESKDIIQPGHTFSDEPGVYIEGKVGVRLEDCFYVNEFGFGVFLTNGVGGQAKSPLEP